MIKRILILTLVYAVLTVIITLTLSQHQLFVTLLVVLNSIYAVLILLTVLQHFKIKNLNISTDNGNLLAQYRIDVSSNFFETPTLYKISQRPFLFGLEKRLVNSQDLYCDERFFYAVDKAGTVLRYPLINITELSRTGIQINNSRIWQVKISMGSDIIEYRFTHNFSMWNKNFLNFYNKIKQIKPQAVQSEWRLWRL